MRPIVADDFESIHQLLSLPETDRYNALGIPKSFEQTSGLAQKWIELMAAETVDAYTLAVVRRSDEAFVGLFGINLAQAKYRRAELWYKLHVDFWGQGYATELSRQAIAFCFDSWNLHRVEAGVAVENIGSIRVLEKSGMTCEGRKRENLPLSTGFSDSFIYSILANEYRENANSDTA